MAREKEILNTLTPLLFGLATLVVSGCAPPTQLAEAQGCEIGPDLLQYCEPPVLPTVYTMEQFDLAFTEAYVCTNQLNAQLAEILRRCNGSGESDSDGVIFAARFEGKETEPPATR